MLNQKLKEWEGKGDYIKVQPFQSQVYFQDYGNSNADSDKTLLLLHGFPESSYSYHKIIEGMSKVFERIVLFDFIGYGLSDKPSENYTYSLFEQADIALQVWKHLGVKGGHLLAHDMGVSVATELLARKNYSLLPGWFSDDLKSLTLTNGSLVLGFAKLRITQKILLSKYGYWMSRLSTFKIFNHQVRSAHGNDKLTEEDVKMLWENILQQNGHRKNHLLIRYLNDRKRFEKTRWLPALSQTKIPIHLCWGTADAVAKIEMAHYLKKTVCLSATLTLMPSVGHFCQLENPEVWVSSISKFYESIG